LSERYCSCVELYPSAVYVIPSKMFNYDVYYYFMVIFTVYLRL
jgi:hypothetical protein